MVSLDAVKGVGPGTAEKLQKLFITTAELLAVQDPLDLQQKTKIGEGTVRKIIQNARELTGQGIFKSGLDIEQDEQAAPRLTTGIEKLDKEILGGFPEGAILEIYGPATGGKTHWCAHLAIRAQMPLEEGGLGGRVLWMDTEDSFRTWILRANAIRWGMDSDLALGNIQKASFVTTALLKNAFELLPKLIVENDIKLVVIDSLSSLFRAEFTGLASLPLRQRELNTLLNTMRKMGTATGTVFVYTNQVQEKIGAMFSMSNQPIGGHILSHGSDYRFYTGGKENERTIKLKDNSGVPPFDMKLNFGWGGFYENRDARLDSEQLVIDKLKEIDKFGYQAALKEIEKEAVVADD
jgi:DNA repair protein RadA